MSLHKTKLLKNFRVTAVQIYLYCVVLFNLTANTVWKSTISLLQKDTGALQFAVSILFTLWCFTRWNRNSFNQFADIIKQFVGCLPKILNTVIKKYSLQYENFDNIYEHIIFVFTWSNFPTSVEPLGRNLNLITTISVTN